MKKMVVLFLSALLAATLRAEDKPKVADAPAAAKVEYKPDDIVARVGKTEIKRKELDGVINDLMKHNAVQGRPISEEQLPRVRYSVLDRMVMRELLLQDAQNNVPYDLDNLVTERLNLLKKQEGGDEILTKKLSDDGLKLADLTKQIRDDVLIQTNIARIVNAKVKVTDDDCKKFYEGNRSRFVLPEQVRASHILILCPADATAEVKTQKLAQIQAARSLVKNGENFATVASKFSEDPGSKEQGGDLGFFAKGRMVPEFEAAAFGLATNQVSDIITTHYGYHVIKVIDRKPAGERTYADAKDSIENYLKNQQGQKVAQQYLKELRDKTKVEILLPEPPPPAMPAHPMPAPQGVAK